MTPPFERLLEWKDTGDTEADGVVQEIEAKLSQKALEGLPRAIGMWEPDLPTNGLDDLLVAYLQRPYTNLPAWVDADRIRQAQRRYQPDIQVGQIVLGAASLPAVYLHPQITVTLMGTGRLMQYTLHRLLETHAFVEVVMTEGALLTPGPSQQWMRKVRLTHAVIRRLAAIEQQKPAGQAAAHRQPGDPHPLSVRFHPRNTTLADGVALNQMELSWVLLTFSWVLLDGMARLGYGLTTPQERDNHVHLWALVGHMIGIVDPVLPQDAVSAQPLFEAYRTWLLARGDPVDDVLPGALEARLLTAALVAVLTEVQRMAVPDSAKPYVARWHPLDAAVQSLPRTLLRMLSGQRAGNILHVGRAPLTHWLLHKLAIRVLDLRRWSDQVPPKLKAKWLSH